MMVPFAALITPNCIVFTSSFGRTYTVTANSGEFDRIKNLIRKLYDEEYDCLMEELLTLVDPDGGHSSCEDDVKKVSVMMDREGVVYYNNTVIRSVLADRIIWGIGHGFSMRPYMKFLENIMLNPSKRVVDDLFSFIEQNKISISKDGYMIGYKVTQNWCENLSGQIVSLPRNQVNDDLNEPCSTDMHFCSQSHLHDAWVVGNKVIVVKVNPRDVVTVPCDDSDIRVCRYEIVGDYKEENQVTSPDRRVNDLFTDTKLWDDEEIKEEETFDTSMWIEEIPPKKEIAEQQPAVSSVEPDIILPVISPIHDPIVNDIIGLCFDHTSGSFRIV